MNLFRFCMVLSSTLIIACGGDNLPDGSLNGPVAGDDAGATAEVAPEFTPRELAVPSAGTCPELTTPGKYFLTSNGVERNTYIFFPSDRPEDMPLIFAWHPLGFSAEALNGWLNLEAMAERLGAVIVVPNLRSGAQTWGFYGDATYDLTLFDDLRTCLSDSLNIDLYRVSTTGMSAGGLWSTYLSIERSDALATAFIMSGGTGPGMSYKPLDHKLPVLLAWGGPNDTYNTGSFTIYFEDTTLDFATNLLDDDHDVLLCDHGLGHLMPAEVIPMMEVWLLNHTLGKPSSFFPEPFGLPDYCAIGTP